MTTAPNVSRDCAHCGYKFSVPAHDDRKYCGPKCTRVAMIKAGAEKVPPPDVPEAPKAEAPTKKRQYKKRGAVANPEFYKRFGGYVAERRKSMGVSTVEMAEILGTTAATVRNIEHGDNSCQFHIAVGMCEALGLPVPTGWLGSREGMDKIKNAALSKKKARIAALKAELEDEEQGLREEARRFNSLAEQK